jgi:hypothetical protein
MCKNALRKMSYVDDAAELVEALVKSERPHAGSIHRAMRSLSSKHGIPYAKLWALRHRKPKSIGADLLDRILLAAERQADEQIRALNEIRTKAREGDRKIAPRIDRALNFMGCYKNRG